MLKRDKSSGAKFWSRTKPKSTDNTHIEWERASDCDRKEASKAAASRMVKHT